MNDLVPIATVSWKELQRYVYEVDGSWRDIYVLDATREDWKVWADFVNANYRVVFNDQIEENRDQIDFATLLNFWDNRGDALVLTENFFVGDIDINCHFFDDEEIENDIDPSKIDSFAVHQQLMDFLTRLSQALRKEVVLTSENDSPKRTPDNRAWRPLLAVEGEQIRVYPYWLDAPYN